mmetsp:Transcript_43139/g.31512  ORF Transcript_43139/g.31512 Transcript_43139/m.31512 type:complete len:155 (+) Transcript_43139:146-610(+)
MLARQRFLKSIKFEVIGGIVNYTEKLMSKVVVKQALGAEHYEGLLCSLKILVQNMQNKSQSVIILEQNSLPVSKADLQDYLKTTFEIEWDKREKLIKSAKLNDSKWKRESKTKISTNKSGISVADNWKTLVKLQARVRGFLTRLAHRELRDHGF